MPKFLYVFSEENKQQLISAGFTLLKEDERNNVYVFEANDDLKYSLVNIDEIMESDVLTF